jgi:hypothetical protein
LNQRGMPSARSFELVIGRLLAESLLSPEYFAQAASRTYNPRIASVTQQSMLRFR